MDNDDKKYIPALRFPEFLNEEKWKIVNGNELIESIVNKKHDSNLPVLAIIQENEDAYDLQKELEAKFDELFGPIDD